MGDYFNTTRGSLTASLTDGSAMSIPPKRWVYIRPDLENSSSVIKLREKGFLVASKVPITIVAEAEAPKAAAVATEAPVAIPAPPPSAPAESANSSEGASTSSMKEEIFKKKR